MVTPPDESRACWYVDVHGNKGVLIGDHNTINFVDTHASVRAVMTGAPAENEAWLAMFEELAGAEADIATAKAAFDTTRGDFRARFSAAVEALIKPLVKPEVFVDIPQEPECLTRAELETLVRPAEVVFSRSRPSKSELLSHLDAVKRRQETRPEWVPRLRSDGSAAPPAPAVGPADAWGLRTEAVTSFPEFDEVTVEVFDCDEGLPTRKIMPGGVGELELVLHAMLGVGGGEAPSGDVLIDDVVNEALVPDDVCWWPRDPQRSLRASQDPGVAAEMLATVATIGGVELEENSPRGVELAAKALAAAGDWRYSRRWRLDGWGPGDQGPFLATAQAAVAGWATAGQSGLLVYVYGGGFNSWDGLSGAPLPLHSYLLCITRSSASDDAIGAVHRLGFACPGDHWCRRGGCGEQASMEIDGDLLPVVTAGQAADLAIGDSGRVWNDYRRLYGTGSVYVDEVDTVLDCTQMLLSHMGWEELERTESDGGMEELLVRRERTCLLVRYDPTTRQVRLEDGKPSFGLFVEMAEEDDEISTPDDVDVEPWHGEPRQISIVGLHPHADGRLHGPESIEIANKQLLMFLSDSRASVGTDPT